MSHSITPMAPVELTDLELDAVAGGNHHPALIEVDVIVRDNEVRVEDINVAAQVLNVGRPFIGQT